MTGNEAGGSGVSRHTRQGGSPRTCITRVSQTCKAPVNLVESKAPTTLRGNALRLYPISSIQLPRMRDRFGAFFHGRKGGDQWQATNSPLTQNFSI